MKRNYLEGHHIFPTAHFSPVWTNWVKWIKVVLFSIRAQWYWNRFQYVLSGFECCTLCLLTWLLLLTVQFLQRLHHFDFEIHNQKQPKLMRLLSLVEWDHLNSSSRRKAHPKTAVWVFLFLVLHHAAFSWVFLMNSVKQYLARRNIMWVQLASPSERE